MWGKVFNLKEREPNNVERKEEFIFSSLFVFFSASVFGTGETTVNDATLSVMGMVRTGLPSGETTVSNAIVL